METSVKKVPKINISEVYGPVAQGEGYRIGQPTIFVRTGGCDFRCSWCDSLYAVLPEHRDEWEPYTASEIVENIVSLLPEGYKRGHITLSGGNPCIQNAMAMTQLVEACHAVDIRVGVETQGTVTPMWLRKVDDVTFSPKPPSSGNITPYGEDSKLAKFLRQVEGSPVHVSLKVVVFDDADYQYAKLVHEVFPDVKMYVQVGTDVGEDTAGDLLGKLSDLQERILADPEMQDVQALPQMHVIMHGHARGI